MKVELPEIFKSFKGVSGKEYTLTDISSGRAAFVSQQVVKCILGQEATNFVGFLDKTLEKLNEGRPVDAGIIISNYGNAIKSVYDNTDAIQMYCAAIYNYEGEDIGIADEDDFKLKVIDWRNIGIDFFLEACLNIMPGYSLSLQRIAASSEIVKQELINVLSNSSKK